MAKGDGTGGGIDTVATPTASGRRRNGDKAGPAMDDHETSGPAALRWPCGLPGGDICAHAMRPSEGPLVGDAACRGEDTTDEKATPSVAERLGSCRAGTVGCTSGVCL